MDYIFGNLNSNSINSIQCFLNMQFQLRNWIDPMSGWILYYNTAVLRVTFVHIVGNKGWATPKGNEWKRKYPTDIAQSEFEPMEVL